MKLCHVRDGDGLSFAVARGGEVLLVTRAAAAARAQGVPYAGPLNLEGYFQDPDRGRSALAELTAWAEAEAPALREQGILLPEDKVRLGPPVPRPGKILCVGRNYLAHIEEDNADIPSHPILFAKFADNALIGPGDPIRLPAISQQVDWEAELGVVIGREARAVAEEEALAYVGGYLNFHDVSARDLQFLTPQWLWGKALDTFAPTGPYLVTADEIPDPQKLDIRLELNGEEMQHSHTSRMIFSVARLIAFISSGITLRPGDIIATGTPEGVGHFRKPPRYLQPGDVVTVEVEGLGRLTNPVVR